MASCAIVWHVKCEISLFRLFLTLGNASHKQPIGVKVRVNAALPFRHRVYRSSALATRSMAQLPDEIIAVWHLTHTEYSLGDETKRSINCPL